MIKNKACPECKANGHDKKDDHLFLHSSGEKYICTKKDYHTSGEFYYEDLDGNPLASSVESKEDDGPIDTSEFSAASIRDIPKDIVSKFGVKVEFHTGSGEPLRHYYPITTNRGKTIVAWKVRDLPKDFRVKPAVGSTKCDLFGMKQSPFYPDSVLITEGELDAMAALSMLRRTVHNVMCLSIPFGVDNISKILMDNLSFLEGVNNVVFCPDQDDPGKKSVEKAALILPDIRIMQISEKDACDMLKAGKGAEFRDAYGTAKKHIPSSIVMAEDIEDEALKPVSHGLSYPFPGLTNLTYGLIPRQIIGIGAGPGAGKTFFTKALQQWILFEHHKKIGIFSLEETPAQTMRSLGGMIIGKPVHLPDCEYNESELRDAIRSMHGLVHIYDHQGYREWQDIERNIIYMAHQGVEVFFIDPLSALTAHLSAADANTYLNGAMFSLSKLVQTMPISIIHVNHLNNPSTGADHGAGGKVYGSQFTGSRAMWKFSTDIWGLERNQYAEDPSERNTTKLVLLKNRLSGVSGSIRMRYDHKSGRLEELGGKAFVPVTPSEELEDAFK
jgi:twinkle protein